MSDFIFSSAKTAPGELSGCIESIYRNSPPVKEFHGEWGSLAVSKNLYTGFGPLETEEHIFIIIGGPVLYFSGNGFLTGKNPVTGTEKVYDRWLSGKMKWDEDLSGPFVILIVDKKSKTTRCITDLMMFIPVYRYSEREKTVFSTHVDALARAADQLKRIDSISLADFIINDVITYPYTFYRSIRQCQPAAEHIITGDTGNFSSEAYWLPWEKYEYENIREAAKALREGLLHYTSEVTEHMDSWAQFISGGEDSRALAGLLPKSKKRDAFIFLDSMNREGKIARRVSEIYKMNLKMNLRSETYYLDIMPEASDLVGGGHQFCHAHSLGFVDKCRLNKFSAVFGGFLADSLLKACFHRKSRWHYKYPFLPEFFVEKETRTKPVKSSVFKPSVLRRIDRRREEHMKRVKQIRPTTAHEWFVLWPTTMRIAMPNFYLTRRLFRSYEPFLANDVVKISAAVPTNWKLNRRLFRIAMKPMLEKSKWLFHGEGWLPYFPWWFNAPLHCVAFTMRRLLSVLGVDRSNQKSWSDWNEISKRKKWFELIEQYKDSFQYIKHSFDIQNAENLFDGKKLEVNQKVSLLQVLYTLNRNLNLTDQDFLKS